MELKRSRGAWKLNSIFDLNDTRDLNSPYHDELFSFILQRISTWIQVIFGLSIFPASWKICCVVSRSGFRFDLLKLGNSEISVSPSVIMWSFTQVYFGKKHSSCSFYGPVSSHYVYYSYSLLSFLNSYTELAICSAIRELKTP